MTVHVIRWQEFNKKGEIVNKEKQLKNKEAADNFIKKLEDSDNFYKITGHSVEID